MKKQTAVEWLDKQIDKVWKGDIMYMELPRNIYYKLIEQAKEMEKQQIKDAYQEGDWDEYYIEENKIWSEQYYNETYKDETT
jgi:hypothetical protein